MLRLLRTAAPMLALVLSLSACKGKSEAAAAGKPGQYADVDCNKMIAHLTELLVREGTKGQPAAQAEAAKKKMQDQRPTMVAACEKEKPVKKLTQSQYDCLMKASSTAELSGCQ